MNKTGRLQNNRILVIDDNPEIHEDIRKILCSHGVVNDATFTDAKRVLFGGEGTESEQAEFEIDSAFQGQEGLAKVQQALAEGRPYAVAFVDVRMPPGWDGVETVKRLWAECPDLQIVICTAYSDYSWEQITRQLGKSDNMLVLKKPFDNVEVTQLAHALTEKWSLNHQIKRRLNDLGQMVGQRTSELRAAISEQATLENQLRQSQKMEAVGQLAAGVAHDFNNILTVIQGNAGLLLAARPPESSDCRLLKTICGASERASKLIRQLLTFSSRQHLQIHPLNIRDTVNTVSEMLPRMLGEHICVEVHVAPDLPLINADGGMLEQMLMNLAVNARDAMSEEGGRLTIRAEVVQIQPDAARRNHEARPGRFVRLSVSDTGCGIPPEILPRIFEPFFTTKAVGKGTGLGLATVYGITKQHQGWIEVQSQPGQGSTFTAFVPVCEKAPVTPVEPAAGAAPGAAEPLKGGHETILVAEDEEDVRTFVVEVLESYGYTVFSAGSGVQALELWSRHTREIDLLLTDMVMPGGLMGRELAERLLAQKPHLKVIYTSGYSPGIAGADLVVLEKKTFLAKPFGPAKLLQNVRSTLEGVTR